MVEHVSTGEQENRDKADRSPEVAVLEDRHNVRRGNGDERDYTEDSSSDRNRLDVVERSGNAGLRNIGGKLAGDPSLDLFRGLRSARCQRCDMYSKYP